MVQSRSSPAVRINLTPMQIPEAVPGAGLAFTTPASMDAAAQSLVLHPGEPSEMIVCPSAELSTTSYQSDAKS
jgi:hypothetical protein